MTIAGASCQTPSAAAVAPTATGIDPDQGPTTGGTTVTLTGTDFVPGDTTVTIDGSIIGATDVTVNPDGTSLSFDTPANPAGPVDVTATTPDRTTDLQTFTYVEATTTDTTPDTAVPVTAVPTSSSTG